MSHYGHAHEAPIHYGTILTSQAEVLELDMRGRVGVGLDREPPLLQRYKQLIPRVKDKPGHQESTYILATAKFLTPSPRNQRPLPPEQKNYIPCSVVDQDSELLAGSGINYPDPRHMVNYSLLKR